MSPAFEHLQQILKKLPGLGARSAERICIHLLAEKPEKVEGLVSALQNAVAQIHRCEQCGNLSEENICEICSNENRDNTRLCIVESISDLLAFEKSAAWDGKYHVLNGKLSPLKGIGPESLNFDALEKRISDSPPQEVLLALPNDIEGEATCHYIQDQILKGSQINISRIGFGLPSGGDITYADATTLRNALDSRKDFQ